MEGEVGEIEAAQRKAERLLGFRIGDRRVGMNGSLADQVEGNRARAIQAFRLLPACPNDRKTARRFLFEGASLAVDPRDDGEAFEPLANAHGGLDAVAQPNLFPSLDHHRSNLLRECRRIEGREKMFLARLQLLRRR